MEADFERFYGRDLAEVIWVERWPASKLWSLIRHLPEDSALGRTAHDGHTTLHELLAQVRDAVVTAAHGYRWQGKPEMYPRPGVEQDRREDALDLTNPAHADRIRRFFGTT